LALLAKHDGNEPRNGGSRRHDDLAGRPRSILACAIASYGSRGSIGVWLFYVQHQFEDTFWAHDEGWNFHEAALHGSSHYDLPNVLRWFTANIGVHHVHHLCSRIPYYRLPRVLRDHPELAAVGRLTLFQSLQCVRMVLWDERRRRLISFREMHILR
jgi:omega-6 fatty acid desaturase (delta-12 desaturase)